MLRHSLLAAAALAALWAGWALASSGHADGACPAQSWARKTGATELWWKVVTACNDHPAQELQHGVNLQIYTWGTATWHDIELVPIYYESQLNASWVATSRFRQVIPYLGIACYRIRTHHFVDEHTKGLHADGDSFSLQYCY